jgi:hypothetical protein
VSKVDAQRAMREARYAEAQARRLAPGPKASPRVTADSDVTKAGAGKRTTGAATKSPAPPTDPAPDGAAELCGHRSIGNKSCRRPAGHTEKNHRYK